ncbi:B box-type domain-containing protein [Citrus sinensis]|nr:B box-type domain-containing protein [Citrus sinensis]
MISQEKYAVVPPWVIAMYKTMFFRNCMVHPNTKKNEQDRFCIDCLCSFCSHCIPAHTRHKHVKIRRYVYNDVINRHDLCKLFDCSGIQTYHTNKTKVLFLKQRNHHQQQQQQQQPINSKDYSCIICDRNLQDNSLYCSIACKVVAIFGDRHTEQMSDNHNKYNKVINGAIKREDLMEQNRKRRRRKGLPLRAPIS